MNTAPHSPGSRPAGIRTSRRQALGQFRRRDAQQPAEGPLLGRPIFGAAIFGHDQCPARAGPLRRGRD
jgi:hypothetical protein